MMLILAWAIVMGLAFVGFLYLIGFSKQEAE